MDDHHFADRVSQAEKRIEDLIHKTELEAHATVVRALIYRSDMLSWDTTDFLIELRRKLNISALENSDIIRERSKMAAEKAAGASTSRKTHNQIDIPPLPLASGFPTKTTKTPKDPCIGKHAMIRRPKDNQFYDVSVLNYDPITGQHFVVVYGAETPDESTNEWIDLKEFSAEDIIWG